MAADRNVRLWNEDDDSRKASARGIEARPSRDNVMANITEREIAIVSCSFAVCERMRNDERKWNGR